MKVPFKRHFHLFILVFKRQLNNMNNQIKNQAQILQKMGIEALNEMHSMKYNYIYNTQHYIYISARALTKNELLRKKLI